MLRIGTAKGRSCTGERSRSVQPLREDRENERHRHRFVIMINIGADRIAGGATNRCPFGLVGPLMLLGLLTLGSVLTQAQNLFPTEIIFDNTGSNSFERHSSVDEYGDEVIFGGTSREVVIFQFEYFGDFTPQGDETCVIRFYANDGELDQGFNEPGTLLFESESFPIFSGFNAVSITDIEVEVPERLTWTADFDGLSGLGGDRAGLIFRDPPEIGISFDDIWKRRRSGIWVATRFNMDPVANFAARFIAKAKLDVTVEEAEILSGGEVRIKVMGPPGQRILVEMSHDLETWTRFFQTTLTAPLLNLIDNRKNVPFPRFVRASLIQDRDIKIEGPRFRDDGLTELTVSGPNGLRFKLQSTTDLEEWKDVAEFTFNTREITIVDNDIATEGLKLYRVVLTSRTEPANP